MKRPRLRRRKPPPYPTSPDTYTEPGCLGPIIVLVICLVVISFLWVAYGWALGELARHGVSVPN